MIPVIDSDLILKKPEKLGDIGELYDYNFPMLEYTNNHLVSFVLMIFDKEKYLTTLGVDREICQTLVKDIATTYNVVPYHHFTHAFSVF